MVAVVEDIDAVDLARGPLLEIGWVAAPESGDTELRKRQFCTPSRELQTDHLHVMEQASPAWRGWIAFRDYLRSHAEAAQEYGQLKTRLASEHAADPNERDAYRAGKDTWIRRTTESALSPPPWPSDAG